MKVKLKKSPQGFKPDPKELAIGMEIEKEHTTDKAGRKRISLQHLGEFKGAKYYTELKKLEAKLTAQIAKRTKKRGKKK
jgi:hypothetical protein